MGWADGLVGWGTAALVLLRAGHSEAFEWLFSYPFLSIFSGWARWTERLWTFVAFECITAFGMCI